MLKKHIRAIGIDDMPFKFSDKTVKLIGSVVRSPNYIEGLVTAQIDVDGDNVTEEIIHMVLDSKYAPQIRVIFTNGITFAGFNVLDLEQLYNSCKVPVITVSRKTPNFEKIETALKSHFTNWRKKLNLMLKHEIMQLTNNRTKIYVQSYGINKLELTKLISVFTVRGGIPEPIRISHIIGSSLYFGETHSKV